MPTLFPSDDASVPAKRPRGRPRKPEGPMSKAEVQRAYRARLAAAQGKAVRVVDAAGVDAVQPPAPSPMPAFDPETQVIIDIARWQQVREELRNALSKLAVKEADAARFFKRVGELEAELRRVEQHNTVLLKETITLQNQLLEAREQAARPRRRASARQGSSQ